jgi:hypothetical protein
MGSGGREIYNAPADEGAAVIDPNYDRSPGVAVGHPHHRRVARRAKELGLTFAD